MYSYMAKFIIGRAINGISINGREFIIDDKGDVMEFESDEAARDFLRKNGIDDPEDFGIDILED